jgi:non-specific serine/threonine protein kinase/serine/threonine-protein kinase
MNAETWEQLKDVFHSALEVEETERAAFLDRACEGNARLRGRVDRLLSSHEQAGSFLVSPALSGSGLNPLIDHDDDKASVPEATRVGQRIGPYQIIREIGRGGMGTVYLATRADEIFDRQVALKLIKRGMDSDSIIKRFVMERQILANLDHPNIARLIDGGTTEDSLPYFVMEHIEGKTITRYCDELKLNTLARLKLFAQVCAAVQFAHRNLIVHRDLKPSNIIVTESGTVKLLDFGIAKFLSSHGPTEASATIGRVLTPEYASPEELRGLPVTTSSDVYSLGVVLYELLSGHRPFNFESRSPEDVARAITVSQPIKPSVVITRIDATNPADETEGVSRTPEAISHTRDGSVEKLRRRLAGDLDNVLLKALRKEPERRYASVQDFSEDLRRHLEGLPVIARPDTLSYRSGKFIKRHLAGVAAAAIVVLILLSATIITAWQARIARQERAKAERRFKDLRNLANSFLFDFHDSIADLNGATKAREMVVKKAQEYLDILSLEAGEDHELLWELSTAYLKLGDVQGRPGFSRTGDTSAALRSYEQSLELRRRLVGLEPNNPEYQLGLAVTLSRFGPIFQVLGKPGAAAERMREGMAITDKLLLRTPDLVTFITASRNPAFLGDALTELGNYDEALAMYQKSLSIAEQMKRQSFPEKEVRLRFVVSEERLGLIFGIKGDWQRALGNLLEMLANTEGLCVLEPASLDYARGKATALDHVGDAFRGLKNYSNALENGKQALRMYEEILEKDPQNARTKKDVGDCSHHVAESLLASGDSLGALTLLQRTVSIRRELIALDASNVEYPDDLAESLMLSGESLIAGGNSTKAIESFQEARSIREPIISAHRERIDYRRGLARLYTDLGDAHVALKNQNEAGLWYQKGLDLWTELQDQHALWAKELGMPQKVADDLAQIHSGQLQKRSP